jgi:ankyrin repeat protein
LLIGKQELGNEINQADDDGVTPFAYACRAGQLAIVEFLASVPEMDCTIANKHLETVCAR